MERVYHQRTALIQISCIGPGSDACPLSLRRVRRLLLKTAELNNDEGSGY